ncbi:hypothetical protein GCM10009721_04460 [Terrabacter tumescens]|uniref:DUF308 domain-containing protein n=1 Tax=Terrabacter tumescens TaxID=60443 RepID=A0ABQ2HKX5_9MICO|nr:hypothetical protein [Terrabacter tumescens]GGM83049.1 hypothetical protein GCM10009721_04460 [Terrabacter tumescens]
MSDPDLDAEFARIIAGWDAEAPDPLPRAAAPDPTDTVDDTGQADASEASSPVAATDRPSTEPSSSEQSQSERPQPERSQAPHGTDPAAPPQRPAAGATGPGPSGPSGLLELPIAPTTAHVWRGGTPPRDDADGVVDNEDHFVPPSEIDLPSAETDPMFWAIVGGLVGGPLLLLYVLFFDRDGSGWWVVTALTMVVVGFVLLVLRGGNERDPFDDGTRV